MQYFHTVGTDSKCALPTATKYNFENIRRVLKLAISKIRIKSFTKKEIGIYKDTNN